jgi:hypothetical protein
MPISVDRNNRSITVTTEDLRVTFTDSIITVNAVQNGAYVPVARTVSESSTPAAIEAMQGTFVRSWRPDDQTVTLEWIHVADPHRVVTEVTISTHKPVISVRAMDAITAKTPVNRFSLVWEFLAGPDDGSRPDFIFTPGLSPNERQVTGQHMFRSPAVIVQHGPVACALIPDTGDVHDQASLRPFLDVRCPKDTPGPAHLEYGIAAYEVDGHIYYTSNVDPVDINHGPVRFACELHVSAVTPVKQAHRAVTRYHWNHHGRESLQDIRPQVLPFQQYFDYGYGWADENLWRENVIEGRRVGAMLSEREYDNDVWFHAWFNQLRTAYGMFLWARDSRRNEKTATSDSDQPDEKRMAMARATRDLVLCSPRERGLFPTIAILPEDGEPVRWVESSLQGGGPGLYHLLDCSWTAWWLLEWHRGAEPNEETIEFCREYGDALTTLQRDDGSWPDYVRKGTHECVTNFPEARELAEESVSGYVKGMIDKWDTRRLPASAEVAGSVLFLAELSRAVPDGKCYLDAAMRGERYLEREVIPEHRWFDYETFFSCSPKPIDFYDARSQQHPQNTMSLYWASEAFRVLADITDDKRLGDISGSLVDYLCLYQQVWSPPFLSAYGFGGFGVMNTDGEWHDARQAIFAEGLARRYESTGNPEYLERSIAATRAGFSCAYIPENAGIIPKMFDFGPVGYSSENYAHDGTDHLAGASGFDWGMGSALTTVAMMTHRFGDLWIDVPAERGFGVNGITVTDCHIENNTAHVTISDPLAILPDIRVRCSHDIMVKVNGMDVYSTVESTS